MSKEEKIKEVYKKLYSSKKIDENGWYDNRDEKIKFHHSDFLGECDYRENYFFRPKSLQGIENNNGWIKIESESDLPSDMKAVFVYWNNEILLIEILELPSKKMFKEWSEKGFTHYQPITKPQPPIY